MKNEDEFKEIEELSDESDFDSIDNYENEYSNDISYENVKDNSSDSQIDYNTSYNTNKSSKNDLSNLKEKIDKNKGYNKTYSKKQAYEKTLDNKNYYNDKKKELEENKNNLKKGKEDNKKRRDTAEKRLEQAKQNKLNNNNKGSRKELKDAKKEDKESKEENKEQIKKEKQLKKDEKNIKTDSKSAKQFADRHPVEAAKMKLNNKINKVKKLIIKKIIAICAPVILGILLAIFIIYLILSPLMEAWQSIDEGITKAANYKESLSNFYNGFGFQNSKNAFYEEVNELYKRYGDSLDVALILSTLFYTEGFGYDTEYGLTESSDISDETAYGSNSGIFDAIKEYLRKKYDDSEQTIDENGLTYNAGKIYRLRKLARNQFNTDKFGLTTRQGVEKTVTLDEFLQMYGSNIAKNIKDLLSDISGLIFTTLVLPFNEAIASLTDSKYQGEYFQRLRLITEDFVDTFKILIGDIFYGIADITDIDVKLIGGDGPLTVNITYRTYKFDEENYTNYLKGYYIPSMPEFKDIIPASGEARERKIDQIIREIYDNKELFESIFLQYVQKDSEVYTESCVGGIDPALVKELELPVKIPEGKTINFVDGQTAFGIRGRTNHNGVDLNGSTAGVNEGDLVYAIADGVVDASLPNVSCNSRKDKNCPKTGAWVRIKHNIKTDNKEYNFYSVYMHLQTKSGQPAIGTQVKKGDVIGKIGNTGDSTGAHLHFEFRENDETNNGKAIDPTNLFIPCKKGSSGTLVGDTIQERIWNYFVSKGYNKFKVAAIMANVERESTFITNNLEDQCQKVYNDVTFTAAVNSGEIGKQEFMASSRICSAYDYRNDVPDGIYGYGLAQWTSPGRKERFYNMKVEYGVSIDDEGLQLDLLYAELEEPWNSAKHEKVWRNADSFEDIGNASYSYCKGFEGGSYCDKRMSVAENYYNQYKDK